MSRILINWEIGENYGHVLPLVPLARALKARGHEITFVLRDLRSLGAQLVADGFRILQAPYHPDTPIPRGAPQPCNAAEILTLFGFSNPRVLDALVSAWTSLYTLIQPALVIGSYAPTSMLAARMAGIPRVLMALGFELPPAGTPLPSLRPWLAIPPERHARAARRVVDAVNTLLRRHNTRIDDFADLFTADRTYLNTWPELDHYGARPGAQYSGPLYVTAAGAPARWPDPRANNGKRIFAYLQPRMPGFAVLMKQLADLPCQSIVAAPGAGAALVRACSSARLVIEPGPVRLDHALAHCDVIMSYAGHGMAAAGLAAGRPMLLLPQNLEQFLLTRRLQEQGVARPLDKGGAEALGAALEHLTTNDSVAARVRQLAAKVAGYDPQRRSAQIAIEIDALLAAPAPPAARGQSTLH